MEQEEIYETIIREMTEHAIRERNKELSSKEQELLEQSVILDKRLQEQLKTMSVEEQQLITHCIETKMMIVDHECAYLYMQGARDCIEFLKKLGIL